MKSFEEAVGKFVIEMMKQKTEWQKKKGDSWRTLDISYLQKELKRQIEQLEESRYYTITAGIAMHELVDMAILACMLYERYDDMLVGGDMLK